MPNSDNGKISHDNLTEPATQPVDASIEHPQLHSESLNTKLDASPILGSEPQKRIAAEKNDMKYVVGYGKPPKGTQFKPGQSGNPKGRPHKTRTFKEDVEAIMRSKIPVIEDGKSRKITKSRAIAVQHVLRAIQGHLGSAKFVVQSLQSDPVEQRDNLQPLLEEFQERYRGLSNPSSKDQILVDPAVGRSTDETDGNS
jgi:hypothetical protein